MDARQQRGLEMAARLKISRNRTGWVVPSATGKGRYSVQVTEDFETCSCPDFEVGHRCKHIHAVEYVIQRELNFDGTVTETVTQTVTETVKRTYPQNWPAYNAAQTGEQDKFQKLLHELCKGIETPPQTGRGQRVLPLADMIFSVAFKVYSTFSGRRFISDLREACERGYIDKIPHFNSISAYLEKPELTPLLRALITETSLPLKAVETDFAVDSSGFTTSRFIRWYDHRYGAERRQHDWVKVHLMCGVKTNVVASVEIRDRHANDSPVLPALLTSTAQRFAVRELSADKQYASQSNLEAADRLGVTPYIAFPASATGGVGGLFQRAYHWFCLNRDAFLARYHKRSNVESTFSMIKRKFGDHLRSKTDVAMINEVLCKILCHNIVVLIHEMHELGIEPTFWCAEKAAAQQLPA